MSDTPPADRVGAFLANPRGTFKRLHAPLGALVMEFASLEASVTGALNALTEMSYPDGAVLESLMQNFSLRIELFNFLSQQKSKHNELKKAATRCVTGLRQANSDRNNLLHGEWTGYNPDDDTFTKIRLRTEDGELKDNQIHRISIDIIEREVKFIIALNTRVSHWRAWFSRQDEHAFWPAPLPDKFPLHAPLHSLLRDRRTKPKAPPQPSSHR
jgi:hypothetical protein